MQLRKLGNKRGQSMGGLYQGILVIASIGILLALIIYVLANIGTSLQTKNSPVAVINESGAYVNSTGYTLDGASALDFASPAITQIINASDGAIFLVGNASVSAAGVVTNASTPLDYGVNISYTYTYSADTTASSATTTMVGQFVAFLPWLGIILLVLAAGVVLFFVIRSFAGGVQRGV